MARRSFQSRLKSSLSARNPITKAKRSLMRTARHPFKGVFKSSKRRRKSTPEMSETSMKVFYGCFGFTLIVVFILVIMLMFAIDSCFSGDNKEAPKDVPNNVPIEKSNDSKEIVEDPKTKLEDTTSEEPSDASNDTTEIDTKELDKSKKDAHSS